MGKSVPRLTLDVQVFLWYGDRLSPSPRPHFCARRLSYNLLDALVVHQVADQVTRWMCIEPRRHS